jgi:hypothetical protein
MRAPKRVHRKPTCVFVNPAAVPHKMRVTINRVAFISKRKK